MHKKRAQLCAPTEKQTQTIRRDALQCVSTGINSPNIHASISTFGSVDAFLMLFGIADNGRPQGARPYLRIKGWIADIRTPTRGASVRGFLGGLGEFRCLG